MEWIIKRGDEYVARPGSARSYTRDIRKAHLFRSQEIARANACENENVKPLRDEFDGS